MNKLPKSLLPCLLVTVAIALVWLFKGPTDQELLANTARAMDFHPWSGWWSPVFLGGASQAPGLTTALLYLVLKPFILLFGPIVGAKLVVLCAAFLGGVGVAEFLRRWTGDTTAAWLGGVAYILGPQMALRLGGNEHLPVVFSMVFAPWILWALLRLVDRPSWENSLGLALLGAGISLAFTKLAVVFAPMALFFVIYLYVSRPTQGSVFLKALGYSVLLMLPLAVVVLLPTLREMKWLAMFQFDPFAEWQQNFSMKSVLSWLDRGNVLQQGMPVGFTADQGGFYVGIVTLLVGLLAWWRASAAPDHESMKRLLGALKVVFGLLLFLTWMSEGPRSVAQGLLEFLKSAAGASDLVIPLFWIMSVGQCVLLWLIWPEHRNRDYARIAAILVYLLVPGFRLFELLPFAHDIRAPWSVWQVGGSLAVASLFGIGAAILIEKRRGAKGDGKGNEKGASALLLLILPILLLVDYSTSLMRYAVGELPQGTYQAFGEIADSLRKAPQQGSIYPLSGRYFYQQLPSLTGKPIEREAFNAYFGLSWRFSLQNAAMRSQDAIRSGLSLMGCSYIFLDKQDPSTPQDLKRAMMGMLPVLAENQFFAVLTNPGTLYPAFLAHDFVALPPRSYAMAPAVLQLTPQNLITVEMAGVDKTMPGFAGMAKGSNQIELLGQYQGKAGQSFTRVPLTGNRMDDYQRMTYQLPLDASGWLVVTEAYHPDWTVTVDGKPADVHRAEAALLSTYVPAGSHEVVFQFKAPSWYSLCLTLGALSWIIALAAMLLLPSKWAPAKWRIWWVGKNSA